MNRALALCLFLVFSFTARADYADSLTARKAGRLDELGALLTVSQRDSILILESEWELDDWIARFWSVRDLSPETPRNERRDEHYRHLDFALENYPALDAPFYDQRGGDYILFGPPDEVLEQDVAIDVFYHPRRLAWIWRDPDMMAEYWDFDLNGVYTQAGADPSATNMARQGNLTLGSMHRESPFFSDPFDDLDVIDRKGAQAEAVELRRDRYRENARAQPLESWFAVNCYRGEAGRVRVEIPWQISQEELTFVEVEQGGSSLAEIRERMVLVSDEGVLVEREPRILRMGEGSDKVPCWMKALPVLSLEPGRYRLMLRLEDRASGRMVSHQAVFQTHEFGQGKLQLSDLAFAGDISESSLPGRFVKGEWKVEPNPRAGFSGRETLSAYFEIYGLTRDAEDLNHYRVRTRILPQSGESPVWAAVASEQREAGEWVRFPLTIAVRNLTRGSYFLEVEVEDLLSGASIARRKPFRLD